MAISKESYMMVNNLLEEIKENDNKYKSLHFWSKPVVNTAKNTLKMKLKEQLIFDYLITLHTKVLQDMKTFIGICIDKCVCRKGKKPDAYLSYFTTGEMKAFYDHYISTCPCKGYRDEPSKDRKIRYKNKSIYVLEHGCTCVCNKASDINFAKDGIIEYHECVALIELIKEQYQSEIVDNNKQLKEWSLHLYHIDNHNGYFNFDTRLRCQSASKLKAIEKIIAKSEIWIDIYINFDILSQVIGGITEIKYDNPDHVLCG